MGERKVLNKYYPPDFDPTSLGRTTKPKNNQVTVRLMLPMSIQCANCGEYIHKGKKFNGRKEESIGENYLGIKVWRFYLKCTSCLSEITFKTDPKRNDYTVERGASRNFEPWKQKNVEEELEKAKKEREEMGDAMKVLENRTEASKREMDLQDAIEEVKELNARAAALTTDQLLDIHSGGAQRYEEAEIERMAAEAFANRNNANDNGARAIAASDGTTKVDPPMPDSDAGAAAYSDAAAVPPAGGSVTLPVLRRLPDAVDLASADFRPLALSGSALDQLEVPDSPTADGARASTHANAADSSATAASAAAAGSSSAAAPTALSSVVPSASSAAVSVAPPLAGLVLLKKRKDKSDDPDKEKKRQKKAAKREAEKKAAAAAQTPDAGGLGGLLGSYGDDSD